MKPTRAGKRNQASSQQAAFIGVIGIGFCSVFAPLQAQPAAQSAQAQPAPKTAPGAALLQAVTLRDRAEAARLLAQPADANARDQYGRTLLYLATATGQADMVALLLDRGADINAANAGSGQGFYEQDARRTPLEKAFLSENPGLLALLIERGADLKRPLRLGFNEQNAGDFLLGISAAWGNAPLVKLLLAKGADAKARGAFSLAVRGGNLQVVKMLLDAGAPVNPAISRDFDEERSVVTPLQLAARGGSRELVALLLDNHADMSVLGAQDTTALGDAVGGGHAAVVALLLQRGAPVNPPVRGIGALPLALAMRNGDRLLADLLLQHGALYAREDVTGAALLNAAGSGTVAQVKTLAANDANARDRDGESALHIAAFLGRSDVVEALLDAGASANTSDERGQTALHRAALGGSLEVVQLLLKRGADVSVRDRLGQTALHLAAFNGSRELVSALLSNHADPNARLENGGTSLYDKGVTALHRAALYNNVGAMRALLDKNANLNAPTENGDTPLHFAARSGAVDAVALLLSKRGSAQSANANARDTWNRTPLLEAVRPAQDPLQSAWSHPAPRPVALLQAVLAPAAETVVSASAVKPAAQPANPNLPAKPAVAASASDGGFDRAAVVALLLRHGASAQAVVVPKTAPVEPLLEAVRGPLKSFDAGNGGDVAASPMRRAVFEREAPLRARIVLALLNGGANIQARDSVSSFDFYNLQSGPNDVLGPTALHLAVEAGDVGIVKLLLDHGAPVNAEDGRGRTPFDWLLRRGEASSRRQDVPFASVAFRFRPEWEQTPPALPDPMSRHAIAILLRAKGGHAGVGPLLMAIGNGAGTLAAAILKDAPGLASHRAARDSDMVGGFVFMVTGTPRDTTSPVSLAIGAKQTALAKTLVTNLPPFAKNDPNAAVLMQAATWAQNWDIVDLLLKKGAVLSGRNDAGDTLLHVAARNGDVQGITLLLGRGMDVNVWDNYARTPLNVAKAEGAKAQAVVDLLEKRGARDEDNPTLVMLRDPAQALKMIQGNPAYARFRFSIGHTMLHAAVQMRCYDIISALLKQGADPNARGSSHATPLNLALDADDVQSATLLLAGGADPNFDPDKGQPGMGDVAPGGKFQPRFARPALFHAVSKNSVPLVKLLLAHGARADIADMEGKTALQHAIDEKLDEIAVLLRDAQATKTLAPAPK